MRSVDTVYTTLDLMVEVSIFSILGSNRNVWHSDQVLPVGIMLTIGMVRRDI